MGHCGRFGGFLRVWMLLACCCIVQPLYAQTLTDQLVKEDLSKLVADARKSGDIVRGAILFHQGNIACAKCHRPAADKDRIGPDLSRIQTDTSDVLLAESILQPSKSIRKGFESMVVVTLQGQVVTGQVVTEDEQKWVLRNGQNLDQVVSIPKAEVAEAKLSSKSSMPEGLVNELKNRQQFLDLLRYVIDVKERGPQSDAPAENSLASRELSDDVKGWVIMNQLNCVACHAADNTTLGLKPTGAPDLKWSAKNLNPRYLAKFISDPQALKPGTTMPHLLGRARQVDGQSAKEVATETAAAIVQFLVSLDGNDYEATKQLDKEAVGRGHELFQSVGCVACHSPRNDDAVEQPLENSIPLGELAAKYDAKALTVFLQNPHVARPSGRMPSMVLTYKEASDVSAFLLQSARKLADEESREVHKQDATFVAKGKRMFSELGCAKCHTGIVDESLVTNPAAVPKLSELNPTRGCLSNKAGEWPAFQLAPNQITYIGAAIRKAENDRSGKVALTDSQLIDITLATYNCTSCHSREKLGGVSEIRSPYFQTTNLNLGEQGRIPPTLTGVGAKLNAKWLRDVLVNHRSIRPYMKTRMPQFGEQNVGHLVDLFQATDHLEKTSFNEQLDPEAMRKQGHTLVGNQGLNCVACHTYQFKLSDTMPAVDLTEMAERLKKDWFVQYMLSPQKFSPNTVMPSYWPSGKAIRADIPGDANSQIEAIWQYLLDGRQANAPQGVVREPLEIVVADEAKVFRRSYPEIGKRGIGVGYSGGVNLAFDAEQMRLATIWKGKFADPSGVWYGQGHGNVRSMGPPIHFPKGPDLDDLQKPWAVDDGRPPKHHFKGYIFDAARRPTFRYEFEEIKVDDFCSEFTHEATSNVHLLRRVTMTSSQQRDGLRFRLAEGKDIRANSAKEFVVGTQLTIHVVSDHLARLDHNSETSTLLVPLEFEEGQVHELKLEYRWERQ